MWSCRKRALRGIFMTHMNSIRTQLQNIFETAQQVPVLFACVWLGSFLILFAILFQIGWVPSAFSGEVAEDEDLAVYDEEPTVLAAETAHATQATNGNDAPLRVIIDAIDVDVTIANPSSPDIATLDQALQSGAVHYPGSGNLEDISNLFLFGHSSYLPDIINDAYTAFNGVQDLKDGDIIRVQSATNEYIYTVDTVELVDANDAWVELTNDEKKLTLSTCNTFGRKQDRYVVEARFIGSYSLEKDGLTS